MLKTTSYFDRKVAVERSYVTLELCAKVLESPDASEVQDDGRIRYWRKLEELGGRYLRVATLADGVTVHNAFIDRTFMRRNRATSL